MRGGGGGEGRGDEQPPGSVYEGWRGTERGGLKIAMEGKEWKEMEARKGDRKGRRERGMNEDTEGRRHMNEKKWR